MPDPARLLRVVRALLALSVATVAQYRSDFLLGMVTGLVKNALRVAPLLLVYWHRDSVSGWSLPQALLVLGFFLALSAVQTGVFEPNLGEAVQAVRTGTLDLLLLKPADAQLLVSLRKVGLDAVWELLSAVLLVGVGLGLLGAPAPLDALMALLFFGSGVVTMYCLWLLAICASFTFVKVDNLRFLLWSVSDAGRWPIDVFSGLVRFLLTAVVPVALITSFPAQALRGTWSAETVGTAAAVTLVFVAGSRWLWRRSLARYTSASS